MTPARDWIVVCPVADIPERAGVAALLPGGRQVAIFRSAGDELHALSNIDPITGAAVLARGIVGDRAGVPLVASPLLKHRYDLRTGTCFDADGVEVTTYPVRAESGMVLLACPPPA